MVYLHNRAGVTSLLAALADQECSCSFVLKHLFSLRPTQLANKPACFIIMWQVLLISFQHVRTEKARKELHHSHAASSSCCVNAKGKFAKTYSSRLSLCIPNQSLMRFCRTPLWLSQLQRHSSFNIKGNNWAATADLSCNQTQHYHHRWATYLRYWSLMLRSWMRSGRRLLIFLSVSL